MRNNSTGRKNNNRNRIAVLLWSSVSSLLFVLLALQPPRIIEAQRFECNEYATSSSSSNASAVISEAAGSSSSTAAEDDGSCVYRGTFLVKAIVHGTKTDPFWQEMSASMKQAAKDMGIQFDVKLYDTYDSMTMAQDITNIGFLTGKDRPDALIVSVPDAIVQGAVGNLIQDHQVPTFGVNVGSNVADAMGVKGFVAIDDYLSGIRAGQFFESILMGGDGSEVVNNENNTETIVSPMQNSASNNNNGAKLALFVNPDYTNVYMEERYFSLSTILEDYTFTKLVVDGTNNDDMVSQLTSALEGCTYRIIQLAGPETVRPLIQAMDTNGCDFYNADTDPAGALVGAFGASKEISSSIYMDQLLFTIVQQTYLEGASPVVMATLYATTGKTFAISGQSRDGTYLSGPVVVSKDTLPSETLELCAEDAFPVCPNNLAPDGVTPASCPCLERDTILIAGITHGVATDTFWDQVYGAATQAGIDFGVDLRLERINEESSNDLVYDQMVQLIEEYCNRDDLSGLFVTLTNSQIVDALAPCISREIPIISINVGDEASRRLGLLGHIGQSEFNAGKQAGQRLIEAGAKRGFCTVHESNNEAVIQRCAGMAEAFNETDGVQFMGNVYVPLGESQEQYSTTVEAFVGEQDGSSWSGIACLKIAQVQLPNILAVQENHADLMIGTFDQSEVVFQALADRKILFSVDQNAYLQGYWPVPFLTWYAQSKQALVNKFIESGPRFFFSPPSMAEVTCEKAFFRECPNNIVGGPGGKASTTNSGAETFSKTATIVAVTFVLGQLFFLWQ